MKVLMFGWEFPPFISGGLGTACFGLTRSMIQKLEKLTFVIPRIKGDADSHVELIGANQIPVRAGDLNPAEALPKELQEKIEIESLQSNMRAYMTEESYRKWVEERKHSYLEGGAEGNDEASLLDISGDYGTDLFEEVHRFALAGKALAKNKDFDIIHAHDWMTYEAGILARDASGKKLVVHMHATEVERNGDNPNELNRRIFELEKWGCEQADQVIAVSYRTRDVLNRYYGIPLEKIQVVHNAVIPDRSIERSEVQRNLKEKIVLFLGRITLQKGPEYFIEAANIVLKKVKNVRFVMAGSGDMLPKMIDRMAELRIQKHFHFTGFLRGQDIEKMYCMSDLYILPSVAEPFGITPIEAMKYDVPVIVSKQAGVAEILPNVTKVDFWDVEKLAASIIDILKSPKKAGNMVEENRALLNTITWDKAAEKVLQVYNGLGVH